MADLISNSSSTPHVIIRAIAKSEEVPSVAHLFRVHTFLLAHHSPVLADMFTLPATSNTNETLDGVPVIDFHDDANGIEGLLKVLYNTEVLSFHRYDPYTPILMLGILRLAVKYDIQPLCRRIIQHFEIDWPKFLDEWDSRNDDIIKFRRKRCLEYDDSVKDESSTREFALAIDNNFPEAASAVEFAKEFDCRSVLLAALYQLATIESYRDWDTYHDPTFTQYIEPGTRTARWNLLHRQSLQQVLEGTKELCVLSRQYQMELVEGVEGCDDEQGCGPHREREILFAFWRPFDPLRSLLNFKRSLPASKVCVTCCSELVDRADRFRKLCWNGLPNTFRL